MAQSSFPLRTVHLDFHTGPDVPERGRRFRWRAVRPATFKEAHVDSVTVFATCHHGHAYYRTEHPCRHPNLAPGLDLTGAQIDALHRAGIRAPIYLSPVRSTSTPPTPIPSGWPCSRPAGTPS